MAVQASGRPLFETSVGHNGAVVVEGPLATAIAVVVVIGMGLIFYGAATGKIETVKHDEKCFSRTDQARELQLRKEGYAFSHNDHRERRCFVRHKSAEPTAKETKADW